jgi:hypothetical protein
VKDTVGKAVLSTTSSVRPQSVRQDAESERRQIVQSERSRRNDRRADLADDRDEPKDATIAQRIGDVKISKYNAYQRS